jgi:hypothetical protein
MRSIAVTHQLIEQERIKLWLLIAKEATQRRSGTRLTAQPVTNQQRNVFAPIGQTRNHDLVMKPATQLQTNPLWMIGRTDHADIGTTRTRLLSQANVLTAALHHTQQHRLKINRKISDLIQKQRPTLGDTDESFAFLHARIGEVATIPKQQRGANSRRQCGSVFTDQRSRTAYRQAMKGLGNQLLSDSAFPQHQHMTIPGCAGRKLFAKCPDRGALSYDSVSICHPKGFRALDGIEAQHRPLTAPYTEQKKLLLQVNRIAMSHLRSTGKNAIHPHRTAPDVAHAQLISIDNDL